MKRVHKLAWIGCIGIVAAPFVLIYGMDVLFGLAWWLDQ